MGLSRAYFRKVFYVLIGMPLAVSSSTLLNADMSDIAKRGVAFAGIAACAYFIDKHQKAAFAVMKRDCSRGRSKEVNLGSLCTVSVGSPGISSEGALICKEDDIDYDKLVKSVEAIIREETKKAQIYFYISRPALSVLKDPLRGKIQRDLEKSYAEIYGRAALPVARAVLPHIMKKNKEYYVNDHGTRNIKEIIIKPNVMTKFHPRPRGNWSYDKDKETVTIYLPIPPLGSLLNELFSINAAAFVAILIHELGHSVYHKGRYEACRLHVNNIRNKHKSIKPVADLFFWGLLVLGAVVPTYTKQLMGFAAATKLCIAHKQFLLINQHKEMKSRTHEDETYADCLGWCDDRKNARFRLDALADQLCHLGLIPDQQESWSHPSSDERVANIARVYAITWGRHHKHREAGAIREELLRPLHRQVSDLEGLASRDEDMRQAVITLKSRLKKIESVVEETLRESVC